MTRSLGDFYMHTLGVTPRPEVISIDLAAFAVAGGTRRVQQPTGSRAAPRRATLRHLTLILASDGIWDLYENEDVFRQIVQPPIARSQSTSAARAFLEHTCRERGADLFGSGADNMTAIVVYLNPAGTATAADADDAHTNALLSPRAPPASQEEELDVEC
jgi:serine/threonine protein phosphatase PrpC